MLKLHRAVIKLFNNYLNSLKLYLPIQKWREYHLELRPNQEHAAQREALLYPELLEAESSGEMEELLLSRVLTRQGFKRKILHDIVTTKGNTETLFEIYNELSKRRVGSGFAITQLHLVPEWEHIHVIHDCGWHNSQCRCSYLYGISVKHRKRNCGIWATERPAEYIKSAINYFLCNGGNTPYYISKYIIFVLSQWLRLEKTKFILTIQKSQSAI